MDRKAFIFSTMMAATIIFFGLSASALGAPVYGSAEWYLSYMQQFAASTGAPSRPAPVTPPAAKPDPAPTPAPAPVPSPAPRPNPAPVNPVSPGQNPNWYLDYLSQYQSSRPLTRVPSAPTPAPNPDPNPQVPIDPPQGLTTEERQLLEYINQERAKAGVGPVAVDLELVRLARIRADRLIETGTFDHNIPGLGTPGQQLTAEGYKYAALGENLAAAGSVYQAHANLLLSSGHRTIMLDSKYTKVGVGVSHYSDKPGVMVIEIYAS